MAQTVQDALKSATLYSDDQPYIMVQLPPQAITAAAGVIAEIGEPFAAVIADKDEVTLIIPEDALPDFERRLPGHRVAQAHYRLITFDVALEPTLIGFMARVSAALANAGIPIFPYSAFTRDHLLVPAEQFSAAMSALDSLRASP